jgi:membrane-associated phospholipid phosphatase
MSTMKRATLCGAMWVLSLSSVVAQPASPTQEPAQAGAVAAPTEEAKAVPPVSSLFRNLGRDIRRLPSLETALVLGVAGATSLGIRGYDRRVTAHLVSSAALDGVFEPGEVIGSGLVQAGAAAATYVAGRLTRSPRAATVGADLVRAQIVNSAITQGLKLSVRRVRPDGGKYSFPSGHSSASFATAAVIGRHFGWKVGMTAHTAAAFVAASRLQENRHFLTDIAFGAAIGLVVGRTVTIGSGPARVIVSAVASPGVAGVVFSWSDEP